MVGPLGAVMGRHIEVYLMENPAARSAYVELLKESMKTSPSALNGGDYIAGPTQPRASSSTYDWPHIRFL